MKEEEEEVSEDGGIELGLMRKGKKVGVGIWSDLRVSHAQDLANPVAANEWWTDSKKGVRLSIKCVS